MMVNTSRFHALPLLLASLALPLGCADPAADAPRAVVDEAVEPTATEPAEDAEVYALSEGSSISFVGSKVTGSHDGGFEIFDGTIELVAADPTRSRVDVKIDATSLWSDDEQLTDHLKSDDFFDVQNYPTATFTSTSIEPDAEGGYRMTGNLDLHGVTKQVSFPAAIEIDEGEVRASAEFAIKRFDFGIVYPGRADDLIRDDVLIRLDLVASPAG